MSKTFDRILIAGVAIATVCIVPTLLRFERSHDDWSEDSAKQIEEMTQNERSDLKANAERLQSKLSEEKREAVRSIHDAVGDPKTAKRFEAYHAWLQELDVVERDSVRSTGSTEKKVTRIQNLLSDEETRSQGFTIDIDDWRIRRFRGEEFARKLKADMEKAGVGSLWISDREYDAMLTVMVKGFPKQIQDEFQQSIANLKPDATEEEQWRLRSNAMGSALFRWMEKERSPAPFEDEYVDLVLNQIEESSTREPIQNLTAEQKSTLVGILRFRSLDLSVYFPTDAQVKTFYTSLTRPEQIELMPLSPGIARKRINLMYVASKEDVPSELQDMAKSMLERFDRGMRESGGRGGRRGSRGDRGDRGGPRGDRDRERERRPQPGGRRGPTGPDNGGGERKNRK
jgi:hypothetical protein